MFKTSLCLSREELKDLTGRCRAQAQIRALVLMGIKPLIRPDGTPVVLRDSLLQDPSITSDLDRTAQTKGVDFKFRYDLLR